MAARAGARVAGGDAVGQESARREAAICPDATHRQGGVVRRRPAGGCRRRLGFLPSLPLFLTPCWCARLPRAKLARETRRLDRPHPRPFSRRMPCSFPLPTARLIWLRPLSVFATWQTTKAGFKKSSAY